MLSKDRVGMTAVNVHLVVQIVIFSLHTGRLELLLTHPSSSSDRWSLPGQAVQPDYSLEGTALNHMTLLTGRQEAYLEQLYTYGEPERNPTRREIAVVYFALIPAGPVSAPSRGIPQGAEGAKIGASHIIDAEQAGWFPVDGLPDMILDHESIVTYALRRLRYKLEYTAVGFELLPEAFTLSELQRTYEIILGEKLDKRNFRRRILESSIIEPTAHLRTGEGRPARLYRYRPDAVAEVKARRLFP
jgi:8-oxo-dGTP diphosphatase